MICSFMLLNGRNAFKYMQDIIVINNCIMVVRGLDKCTRLNLIILSVYVFTYYFTYIIVCACCFYYRHLTVMDIVKPV